MFIFASCLKSMKRLFYTFFIVILFSSCSEYQKVLKSDDIGEKFTLANSLFDEGKYGKAQRIFEQIVPQYRGKPQAQKLMYMHALTYYHTRDYYTANYHMERFVNAYPDSEKVQEMAFLGAKSYYHLPPIYSKEQEETVDAIDKLQSFINLYPNTEYTEEANRLVQELNFKLERKAYEIAKQYHTLGPHNRDFEAAIKAFDNFILDFPGTSFREDAMFYRFDSAYELAINSVESKKEDRIDTAVSMYSVFKNRYTESKHLEEGDKKNETLLELQKQYNNQG